MELEAIAQSDLQSARIAGGLLRDFPERGGSRGVVGGSQVGMVDEVIGLSTELNPILPVDGESFDEREIPVLQPRRVDVVANTALKVKCPSRRRGPDGISTVCRAEPLRAARSTFRAGKTVGGFHASVLHPELAYRCRPDRRKQGRFAIDAANLTTAGVVVRDSD